MQMLWDSLPSEENLLFSGTYFNDAEPPRQPTIKRKTPISTVSPVKIPALDLAPKAVEDLKYLFVEEEKDQQEQIGQRNEPKLTATQAAGGFDDILEIEEAEQEVTTIRLPSHSPAKTLPLTKSQQPPKEDIVQSYRWIFTDKVRSNHLYLEADWTQPDMLLQTISLKTLEWWMAEWLVHAKHYSSFDLAWAQTATISEENWKTAILPTLCQTICQMRAALK